jgi:hypothetical protein
VEATAVKKVRVNVSELNGKPFAVRLTDEDNDSAVFSGIARWDGSTLLLDRSPKPAFEIRAEWHERIQLATNVDARKILLGADYFLRLYVGKLPDDAAEEYEQTGLKWPE